MIAALNACSAGNNRVDPEDLALRDLLGVSPDTAMAWDGAQRAAARRVLDVGLRDDDAPSERGLLDASLGLDERLAQLVAANDLERASDGASALGVVRVAIDARSVADLTPRSAPLAASAIAAGASGSGAPRVELRLAERWSTGQRWSALPDRGAAVLAAIAADAGHPGGPLVVVPAPRLAVIAAYLRPDGDAAVPRLAINPVALAALEPLSDRTGDPADASAQVAVTAADPAPAPPAPTPPRSGPHGDPRPGAGDTTVASTGGNPYSFYGSVAECALAQRQRCEDCLRTSSCRPITNTPDGNAECTMLAADDGRGYFLECINLSLAISSVDDCTGDAAPSCVRDPRAADSLGSLNNNASFLSDPMCGDALDGCLAKIFGAPDHPFPAADAGTGSIDQPRPTSINCSNSCSNDKNTSCNASPTCDFAGPSCNNSLSCDSACSNSNDQSGCGGNCNACTTSGGGGSSGGGGCSSGSGGGGGGGGGCSSGSGGSSSSSGCGGGCSSGSGSSSSSGCGGGSSSGGSCGIGCGGSGCSGGGCGGGSSSSSCGGGGAGGGGKCSVAAVEPAPGVGLAVSVLWGCLPIAFAALTRRRTRRCRPPCESPPHELDSAESPSGGDAP